MTGPEFLHTNNQRLHLSPEIEHTVDYLRQHGSEIPYNKPAAKLEAYIEFLADPEYVNDGFLTGNEVSIDRQTEISAIDPSTIPQQYFDQRRQTAIDNGQEPPAYNTSEKLTVGRTIHHDQRVSLGRWAKYLNGEYSNYDTWFKFYVMQTVVELGGYNKKTQQFSKRTKETTAHFPDLNQEALAIAHDGVKAFLVGNRGDMPKFATLYGHALRERAPLEEQQRQTITGSWRKFDRIVAEDVDWDQEDLERLNLYDHQTVQDLVASLDGHGTGWCTAGEADATEQLCDGDFHVYYSQDSEGNDTIPRIAIRMYGDIVTEVRGINANQEMEPEVLDIVRQKLAKIPGGESYFQKVADMQRLTTVYALFKDNPEAMLSAEDLCFIYEINREIIGFNLDEEIDPRMIELQTIRKSRLYQDIKTMCGISDASSVAEQLFGQLGDEVSIGLQTLYIVNLTSLVHDEDFGGREYLLKHLRSLEGSNDWKKHLGLFVELGVVDVNKARRWLCNGVDGETLEKYVQNGYFKNAMPLTFGVLKKIVAVAQKRCNARPGQGMKPFKPEMLKALFASVSPDDNKSIELILSTHFYHTKETEYLIEAYKAHPVVLPRPEAMALLTPALRKILNEAWDDPAKIRASNLERDAFALLCVDAALRHKQTYRRNSAMFNTYSNNRISLEMWDHNRLARKFVETHPDDWGTDDIVESLKNLNRKTYRTLAALGKHTTVLRHIGNFTKDVDSNEVVFNAARAGVKLDYIVHCLDTMSELKPEVVDLIAASPSYSPSDILKCFGNLTEAGKRRAVERLYTDAPLSLLGARHVIARKMKEAKRSWRQEAVDDYKDPVYGDIRLPVSILDYIDEKTLLATMLGSASHRRSAIINRKLFRKKVFKDGEVINTIRDYDDAATVYWALDKKLLVLPDADREVLMHDLQGDSQVQSYLKRDKSLDF